MRCMKAAPAICPTRQRSATPNPFVQSTIDGSDGSKRSTHEFFDDFLDGDVFLLRLFGGAVNLIQRGDARDDFSQPVAVKRCHT